MHGRSSLLFDYAHPLAVEGPITNDMTCPSHLMDEHLSLLAPTAVRPRVGERREAGTVKAWVATGSTATHCSSFHTPTITHWHTRRPTDLQGRSDAGGGETVRTKMQLKPGRRGWGFLSRIREKRACVPHATLLASSPSR